MIIALLTALVICWGHQVDDEAKLQIGLPTNQGGLGLYRVGSMALSAFVACRTEVAPFADHLIGEEKSRDVSDVKITNH